MDQIRQLLEFKGMQNLTESIEKMLTAQGSDKFEILDDEIP